MRKPNFERFIGMMLGDEPDYPTNTERIELMRNGILADWEADWEEIEEGNLSYPVNEGLVKLLSNYQLEDFLTDFYFLGIIISERIKKSWDYYDSLKSDDLFDLELLGALNFLLKGNADAKIKLIGRKNSASITHPDLIEIINDCLTNYFKNSDFYQLSGYPSEDGNKTWAEYITERLNIQKSNMSMDKGRKPSNPEYKKVTNWLRRYLEFNTKWKTEEGKFYSNDQVRFIFRFLQVHGLIKNPELITYPEDVVGYYLKSEKKSQEKHEKYMKEMLKKGT